MHTCTRVLTEKTIAPHTHGGIHIHTIYNAYICAIVLTGKSMAPISSADIISGRRGRCAVACMYVCVCVYGVEGEQLCVFLYVCMYACIYVYMTYNIYIYMYMQVCICLCMQVCI